VTLFVTFVCSGAMWVGWRLPELKLDSCVRDNLSEGYTYGQERLDLGREHGLVVPRSAV
jgi:hypothetical protein